METRMFTWIWIFEIVLYGVAASASHERPSSLPNITSCEEFEQHAYFDPKEIVDSVWKIFYFWGENTEMTAIVFSLLTSKRVRKLKAIVDSVVPELGVDWRHASFLMVPRAGVQIVMLHQSTPGAYRALIMTEPRGQARPIPPPEIDMADVRIKQVGRIMGFMSCEQLTAYALARVKELPVTEADCVAQAQALGYHGPSGKSYLYVKSLMKTEL